MPVFQPVIESGIFSLRPDFRALSIHAEGVANSAGTPETAAALASACKSPCAEPWAEAHLDAWRSAYRAFGAKPQRTPCSAAALLKRVERDGTLPGVNAIVDLYNAVSIRFAIPVGGENADAYVEAPLLTRASGSEALDPMPTAMLLKAGSELVRGLKSLSPESAIVAALLTSAGSSCLPHGDLGWQAGHDLA